MKTPPHVGDPCRRRRTSRALILLAALASMLGPGSLQAQDPLARAPLTLADLLSAVFSRHPLIEASRARVAAAEGTRTTAGLLGNPLLSYQVDNTSVDVGGISAQEREVMTVATFPLEVLYQRAHRVRGADASVRGAAATAAATRQRVALDAVGAFYRVALAQERVSAARDLAAWLDTVVAYNRTRVEEGAAAEAELLRAELERDRVLADVAMESAGLAPARATLNAFLGDIGGGAAALSVAGTDQPLLLSGAVNRLASAAIDTTLRLRPDLRAARERVIATRAAVSAERAMTIRQLSAMVGAKQMGGTTSLVAGFSVPLPLFDLNRGEIARATADGDAARLELEAQERTARADVRGAGEAAQLLKDRAIALASSGGTGFLMRADEARRIALGAYREGGSSLLQVLDAARAWGDSRVAYYRVLYAQHESVFAVLAAQGLDVSLAIASVPVGGSLDSLR